MEESMSDNPGVIAFPPALYAGTLLIGLLLSFVFPIGFLPRSVALVLGALVIICSGLIAISAFRVMNRAQTAVNPSQPTTTIVSDGVFTWSRNPIYLSLTLLYIGSALLFSALWALLLLLPRRWRRLLGKTSLGGCNQGDGGATTEKHASPHAIVRHVEIGHCLPPIAIFESVAVTPNDPDHQTQIIFCILTIP